MPAFDRVSEVYDATRSLRPDVREAVLDGLEQALGGTNPLLDVGVGTGRFADPLRRLGFEVVGVDLSRRMMAKAREKRIPDLILADAESLPLRSKSFEVAMMVHLLHLVDGVQEVAYVFFPVLPSTWSSSPRAISSHSPYHVLAFSEITIG